MHTRCTRVTFCAGRPCTPSWSFTIFSCASSLHTARSSPRTRSVGWSRVRVHERRHNGHRQSGQKRRRLRHIIQQRLAALAPLNAHRCGDRVKGSPLAQHTGAVKVTKSSSCCFAVRLKLSAVSSARVAALMTSRAGAVAHPPSSAARDDAVEARSSSMAASSHAATPLRDAIARFFRPSPSIRQTSDRMRFRSDQNNVMNS